MEKSIAILILFYNKLSQTVDSINSFLSSGQRMYVLNNGSDEAQWHSLQRMFSGNGQVSLLNAEKNIGVSAGRNLLINHTNETWLFCVDNDIVIKEPASWYQQFISFIDKYPEVKIICPKLYNVHENAYASGIQIVLDGNTVSLITTDDAVTNCFPGGASIVNRSIYNKYGGYDEEMFVGFEDYEYALRAIKKEQPLVSLKCNDIELVHNHPFQQKKMDKEAVRHRYNEEKLEKSYNRMVSKYGIVFEHEWQWWCRKQVSDMTVGTSQLSKFKNAVKFFFGR